MIERKVAFQIEILKIVLAILLTRRELNAFILILYFAIVSILLKNVLIIDNLAHLASQKIVLRLKILKSVDCAYSLIVDSIDLAK